MSDDPPGMPVEPFEDIPLLGTFYVCPICLPGRHGACAATSPDGEKKCTREEGHPGDHIACAFQEDTHPVMVWSPIEVEM